MAVVQPALRASGERTALRWVALLVFTVALPFSLSAAAEAEPEAPQLARIAYVTWVCDHYLSGIVAADVAGRRRETITTPERCRRFRDDELARDDTKPRWAPDGRSLAFVRNVRRPGVYVWTRGEQMRRIDATLVDLPPAWSPDGKQIALATQSLWITGRQGDHKRILLRGRERQVQLLNMEWSPDASRLLFIAGDNTLKIIPVTGGQPRLVARDVLSAAWSPDNRQIAYATSCIAYPGDSYVCKLYIVRPGGGKPKRLTLTVRDPSLAWARDSRHLLVGGTEPLRIVDVQTGRVRTVSRDWVEFTATSGPGRGDLRLARLAHGRPSLAFISSTGTIKTKIVVPRGYSTEADEIAAYVPE